MTALDPTPTDRVTVGAPPVLACHDVVVSFGRRQVVDGVGLEAAAGEWLAVVGPNGAGKSTLLRAVAGLLPVAGGRVELGGEDVAGMRSRHRARRVALVPQAPVVPAGMTVGGYVLLGRTPYLPRFGAEGPEDLAAARRAIALLGLADFVDRPVAALSGGERQRVFVARALAQETPVVLLDEPTTGLDLWHQQEVLELIDGLRRDRGLTVVSTMHDLTLISRFADRLVLVDDGRIVAGGTAAEILTPETLARWYGANVRVIQDPTGPVIVPLRPAREERA
jgi:iron complex transport system ATP-binding protein